jgi:hypothetical protein
MKNNVTIYALSVGGRGSGVTFHIHTAAYCLLLSGSKKWYLQSPIDGCPSGGVSPGRCFPHSWAGGSGHHQKHGATGTGRSQEDELDARLVEDTASSVQPRTCVQRAGELVFIPEGWWHATKNLELSVALAGQDDGFNPTGVSYKFDLAFDLMESDPRRAGELFSEVSRAWPRHCYVWNYVGAALASTRQAPKLVSASFRRAVKVNPRYVCAPPPPHHHHPHGSMKCSYI